MPFKRFFLRHVIYSIKKWAGGSRRIDISYSRRRQDPRVMTHSNREKRLRLGATCLHQQCERPSPFHQRRRRIEWFNVLTRCEWAGRKGGRHWVRTGQRRREGTRKLINFSLLVLHEEIPPISTMRARVASEKQQQQQPTTRSKSWREEEVEGITRRRQWNKMKMHFLQRTRWWDVEPNQRKAGWRHTHAQPRQSSQDTSTIQTPEKLSTPRRGE